MFPEGSATAFPWLAEAVPRTVDSGFLPMGYGSGGGAGRRGDGGGCAGE